MNIVYKNYQITDFFFNIYMGVGNTGSSNPEAIYCIFWEKTCKIWLSHSKKSSRGFCIFGILRTSGQHFSMLISQIGGGHFLFAFLQDGWHSRSPQFSFLDFQKTICPIGYGGGGGGGDKIIGKSLYPYTL